MWILRVTKHQRCAFMWSRPSLFLLININITKEKRFRLILPLPLFIIYGFSDMIMDMMDFAALFVPRKAKHKIGEHSKVSFQTVHSSMTCAHLFLKGLFMIKAPWELCSVDADGVKANIKFY